MTKGVIESLFDANTWSKIKGRHLLPNRPIHSSSCPRVCLEGGVSAREIEEEAAVEDFTVYYPPFSKQTWYQSLLRGSPEGGGGGRGGF